MLESYMLYYLFRKQLLITNWPTAQVLFQFQLFSLFDKCSLYPSISVCDQSYTFHKFSTFSCPKQNYIIRNAFTYTFYNLFFVFRCGSHWSKTYIVFTQFLKNLISYEALVSVRFNSVLKNTLIQAVFLSLFSQIAHSVICKNLCYNLLTS